MKLLVTRPFPESQKLAETLRILGHTPFCLPLLRPRFYPLPPLSSLAKHFNDPLQGSIFTSPRALRALKTAPDLPQLRKLPAFCVGATTAGEARRHGFIAVHSAQGTAQSLLSLIQTQTPQTKGWLLYLAAANRATPLEQKLEAAGCPVFLQIVYEMIARRQIPSPLLQALREGSIEAVLLYSQRSAEIFCQLLQKAQLNAVFEKLHFYVLSEAVASPIRRYCGKKLLLELAPIPTSEALLELLPFSQTPV